MHLNRAQPFAVLFLAFVAAFSAALAGFQGGLPVTAIALVVLLLTGTGAWLFWSLRRSPPPPVASSPAPLPPGEILKLEEAVRRSEETLVRLEEEASLAKYALEHAQDLISIMGHDGKRIYVNQAFCDFTGRSREELLTHPVWEGIPSLGEQGYKALWEKIRNEGSVTLEIDVLTKAGELKPVETKASYVRARDIEAVCTVSRDLEPRRRAEEEKARIEQQFRETQKLESLGVLAGGVAHDFNNLLTTILGNASLARDRLAESDPMHGPLQQIEIASEHAAELCQQMLAYAGKGSIHFGPVDLSHLVGETANLLSSSVAHRANLDLRLAKRLPAVLADTTQMRQILMNLVLNAAEACDHADGRITVSTSLIQLDASFLEGARVSGGLEPGPAVCLEVSDNGCGMDEETLERAFEPFFTTKFKGRGLGLAAVIGIIRAHSAALSVTSAPGRGTSFRLAFAPETRRRRPRQPFARPAGTTRAPFAGASLLVVDDEESVRAVALAGLNRFGFKTQEAATGEEALRLLTQSGSHFDLVLLDLTLPHPNGVEILRTLREHLPNLPVMMMSGYTEEETRARLGDLRAEGFLMKPFNIGTLRDRVTQLLRESRARDGQIEIPF